jgi:demethylmenaquinone methyltransferase/2-methoxy-6-polyprenyl-1,4-benzoquinol methylase
MVFDLAGILNPNVRVNSGDLPMLTADSEIQRYYAARALDYETVYAKPERRADLKFLASWVPSMLAGRHVLEVACGTGYWTRLLEARSARITALDVVKETIEIANSRLAKGNVQFLVADAFDLPHELGTFNAAFAGLWISHIPKGRLRAFFTGLHRRLQPGSSVLLLDNNTAQLKELPLTDQDAQGNTYQIRVLQDGTTYRVLKNFPTQSALIEIIEGIGRKPQYRMLENFWIFLYETK